MENINYMRICILENVIFQEKFLLVYQENSDLPNKKRQKILLFIFGSDLRTFVIISNGERHLYKVREINKVTIK